MALPLRTADETVFVDRFTDGVLDPAQPMLGPVRDGGTSSPTPPPVAGGR